MPPVAIKPRWITGLEGLAVRYRNMAAARRVITSNDPVADALDFAATDLEAEIRRLQQPTVTLTCDEWGAEQEPPVSGKTARRWCQAGELEHDDTPGGIRIPASAVRIPKKTLVLAEDGASGESETSTHPPLAAAS